MAEFEDSNFEDQIIALTVPASFDDVARELTVEASEKAGYKNVSLIEEPQAAFYDWLATHESMWKRELKGLSDILVCDVGGGTTDFTIIRAEEKDGDVFLKRASVGDHLLLGGDNMDMALALKTEKEYLGKKKLDPVMFASLCGECRLAKEKMLEKDGLDKAPITVLGRGSKLINSSIHAELRRDDCVFELENGFFPKEEFKISKNLSAGLSEWGLPYQKNPKITAHMADFIKTHMKNGTFPNAVLFNGGVFRSEALRNRLREQLEDWGNGSIRVLENESLDLAVTKATEDAAAMRQETKDLLSKALGKAIELFNSSFDDSMKNLKKQIDCSVNELKSVDLSSETMQKYVKPLPMLTKATYFIAGMATVVILGFLVFLSKSF